MIKPTNGRIVWFTPGESDRRKIAQHDPDVWGDRCVNLAILDSNGNAHQRTSVTLVQDGDPCDPHNGYAEWMPYQKGQAAKTEAAETALSEKGLSEAMRDNQFAGVSR